MSEEPAKLLAVSPVRPAAAYFDFRVYRRKLLGGDYGTRRVRHHEFSRRRPIHGFRTEIHRFLFVKQKDGQGGGGAGKRTGKVTAARPVRPLA